MLHRFPCLSLSKDCFLTERGANFVTILSVSLLSLKGFLVERTTWDYFLVFASWDLPIESVLLICLILY